MQLKSSFGTQTTLVHGVSEDKHAETEDDTAPKVAPTNNENAETSPTIPSMAETLSCSIQ